MSKTKTFRLSKGIHSHNKYLVLELYITVINNSKEHLLHIKKAVKWCKLHSHFITQYLIKFVYNVNIILN